MDKVLASEAVQDLSSAVSVLREKLRDIQQKLPAYEELTSCMKNDFSSIQAVSVEGVGFHSFLDDSLVPVFHEFGICLDEA